MLVRTNDEALEECDMNDGAPLLPYFSQVRPPGITDRSDSTTLLLVPGFTEPAMAASHARRCSVFAVALGFSLLPMIADRALRPHHAFRGGA